MPLQFARQLGNMTAPSVVIEALSRVAQRFGVDIYSAIRLANQRDDYGNGYVLGRNVFFGRSVPDGYLKEYLSLASKHGRSILANKAWTNPAPFTITEGMRATRPTGKDRWILDLFAKCGVRDGLYCPAGRWVILFSSPRVLRLGASARASLAFIAYCAAERLEEMVGKKSKDRRAPALSPREVQILLAMSRGMTDAEIAAALTIRPATVRSTVWHAMRKLGAKTREQAVAEAIRTGHIR